MGGNELGAGLVKGWDSFLKYGESMAGLEYSGLGPALGRGQAEIGKGSKGRAKTCLP